MLARMVLLGLSLPTLVTNSKASSGGEQKEHSFHIENSSCFINTLLETGPTKIRFFFQEKKWLKYSASQRQARGWAALQSRFFSLYLDVEPGKELVHSAGWNGTLVCSASQKDCCMPKLNVSGSNSFLWTRGKKNHTSQLQRSVSTAFSDHNYSPYNSQWERDLYHKLLGKNRLWWGKWDQSPQPALG